MMVMIMTIFIRTDFQPAKLFLDVFDQISQYKGVTVFSVGRGRYAYIYDTCMSWSTTPMQLLLQLSSVKNDIYSYYSNRV